MQWSRLQYAVPSEVLKSTQDGEELLEINSGGQVLFCFLSQDEGTHIFMSTTHKFQFYLQVTV